MTVPVIKAESLTKRFVIERPLLEQIIRPFGSRQSVCALDGVSFTVEAGQILGVVGSNGAGKTTLLRILADILEPDEGTVEICGQTVGKSGHRIRRKIGYVSSDERSFFWRLSGMENLEFFGQLYGLSRKQTHQRIAQVMKCFGLGGKANQLFRDYSTGTRKKFAIIRALLHQPCAILLDEVTNSLDPESTKNIKTFVREHISSRENCAIVWSTHRLGEITEICDKVLVIANGSVQFYGPVSIFQDIDIKQPTYVLQTRNLNGKHEMFHKQYSELMAIESSQKADMSEFIFKNISSEKFDQIVSVAVKDYGAYIIFAGRLTKMQGDSF
ncbi:ABC transporter ATP-binding protein [Planctomycetota bacterium]